MSSELCLGFVRSQYDYCLYTNINEENIIFLLLYVDDFLIAGTDDQLIAD